MNDFPYDDLTDEYWANESKKDKLETAIRAAIKHLDTGGLSYRERETIFILQKGLEDA